MNACENPKPSLLSTLATTLAAAIPLTALLAGHVFAGDIQTAIRADQPGKPNSPDLFGVFFEDINCAADGGLYAELVQNYFDHTNVLLTANAGHDPRRRHSSIRGNPDRPGR